jgi:hypothetical protein
MGVVIVHQHMTHTRRMLAALALTGAALTTSGTAQAAQADNGGQVIDQSSRTAANTSEDGFFSGVENTLTTLADLLGHESGGRPG